MARNCVPAIALAVMGVGFLGTACAQGESCDKACLQSFADRFTKAMVEHEPGHAPLAKNVRYTENGQFLKPGDGLWATASDDATYRLYATDVPAGQVVFIGVLKEGGDPVIVAARLRVESRLITQAEVIAARSELSVPFRPELLTTPRPILTETVDSGERLARENMLGIVNAYFDGYDESNSGRRIAFDKDCQRVDNGVETAGASDPNAEALRKLSCQDQLNTGYSKMITAVRERRYIVTDIERGLVFAVVFFDYNGQVRTVKLNDGTTMAVPAAMQHPASLLIGNLVKIKNGRIRQVEGVMVPVPYGMRSGWAR